MTPCLEVRIPISPLDHYYNRVHLIAHSIRSLGGRYADAGIRVTIGADAEPQDLHKKLPWSRRLNIDWRWIDRREFLTWSGTAHPYIATMMERFRPPFDADNILMLDADVIAMRPFDELLTRLETRPGIAGVMAHVSPFQPHEHEAWWRRFFKDAGLAAPEFAHALSGWGLMDHEPTRRLSPPYFNTGVLLAPRALLAQLYDPYMECLVAVRKVLDTYFFEQIALTVAMYRAGLPFHVVPLRYNFPNQAAFDAAQPGELRELCFLHFLRSDVVKREADFVDLTTLKRLVARQDLSGSNEKLRQRVAELLPILIAGRTAG
jgi:hypothetical protein